MLKVNFIALYVYITKELRSKINKLQLKYIGKEEQIKARERQEITKWEKNNEIENRKMNNKNNWN